MKYLKGFWQFMGTSSAWLAMFLILIALEWVFGQTLKGIMLTFVCVNGFFLSRIAEALEKAPECRRSHD